MDHQVSTISQNNFTFIRPNFQDDDNEENMLYIPIDDDLNFFDLRHYDQKQLIGQSNHRVHLYETTKSDLPFQVAVKTLLVPHDSQDQEDLLFNLLNIYKIQSTNHKNIIQIYGFCQVTQQLLNGGIQIVYLVSMEYLPYNLNQRIEVIRKTGESAPLEEFQNALLDLTNAAVYFQNLGQCHSDLKPENILIDSCTQPTIFKLCDLDNLQYFSKGTRYQYYNITTFIYQPPEIREALHQGVDQIKFNAFKADVYSMGLCLIQLHHKASIQDADFGTQIQIGSICRLIELEYGSSLFILMSKILEFKNHARPDFITIATILNSENSMDQSSMRKNLEESLIKMSSQMQIKRQGTPNIDSRCTIDMNDIVFDKRDKRDNNIASCKTLSSNQSPASRNQTPLAKYTQPILSNFGRQQQKLRCSIEEVLDDNEDDSLQKRKHISATKPKVTSAFAKMTIQLRQISFDDDPCIGQSQHLNDCESETITPVNHKFNEIQMKEKIIHMESIEEQIIDILSISYNMDEYH